MTVWHFIQSLHIYSFMPDVIWIYNTYQNNISKLSIHVDFHTTWRIIFVKVLNKNLHKTFSKRRSSERDITLWHYRHEWVKWVWSSFRENACWPCPSLGLESLLPLPPRSPRPSPRQLPLLSWRLAGWVPHHSLLLYASCAASPSSPSATIKHIHNYF